MKCDQEVVRRRSPRLTSRLMQCNAMQHPRVADKVAKAANRGVPAEGQTALAGRLGRGWKDRNMGNGGAWTSINTIYGN